MTPFDSSVKIKTGQRPHGMLPADPSVAADMPDLTGAAIVHNQRYDESVPASAPWRTTPLATSTPSTSP